MLAIVVIVPTPRGVRFGLGSRMPCLPEETIDDGTGRNLTGSRWWDGQAEFFVSPDVRNPTEVGYLEVGDAGFATPEAVKVGSRLGDVLKAGGKTPSLLGARLCISALPSGWDARFEASVCSGNGESGADVTVRRLVSAYWRR
jgi:hypothetical protein